VQQGLRQLVEAEFLYQQGLPPQATYLFKHALIQDTAYQSLLRSTRQHYHQRIAEVLEAQFPETVTTQPALLAHHYTEAGHLAQALQYWQRAGHQALQRSANMEAVQHLSHGLALLATLPATPERVQQEIDMRLALGPALVATRGHGTPDVEQTYARARALCAQAGEMPQLLPALRGLCWFYISRGVWATAQELGEQLVRIAQQAAAPTPRLEAYDALGHLWFFRGHYASAWTYLEQALALIDPAAQQAQALQQGEASGVRCLTVAAATLWCLGYPTQARRLSQEALAVAHALDHPQSLAVAHYWAALLHHRRRETAVVQTQAEALLTLATAQQLPLWVGHGTCWQGWGLAMRGQAERGLAQLHQGLATVLATGQTLSQPLHLVLVAEALGCTGQRQEEGQRLVEALSAFEASGREDMHGEAYRLQGDLLLRLVPPDVVQAETCFQQALTLARRQQAKSWELRAAISLARLWQRQGKHVEAHALLAPVYRWFTEGFDTADLQDAKALLDALGASHGC
jgi:predicted ATPase